MQYSTKLISLDPKSAGAVLGNTKGLRFVAFRLSGAGLSPFLDQRIDSHLCVELFESGNQFDGTESFIQ